MDAFERARIAFVADLSTEEAALISATSKPEELLHDVESLEAQHKDQSKIRHLLERLRPFVEGVKLYEKAFDILINLKPEVLSIIWGSARVILSV